MSLINEALRRAEEEKRQQQGIPAEPASRAAAGEQAPPAAREHHGLRGAIALGAFVVVAVVAVMYFSLPPQHRPARTTPRAPGAVRPDPTRAEPPGEPPEANLPAEPDQAAAVRSSVDTTLQALMDYQPGESEPPLLSWAAPPAQAQPPPLALPLAPAPAGAGATSLLAQASPPAAIPGTSPPEGRPPPSAQADGPPPLDAGDFKLGGIIRSGSDSHALINDHLVSVGDQVAGARVVEIGRYHVVLEKDGQRLTLRM